MLFQISVYFTIIFLFVVLLTVGPLELFYGKQLLWVEVHIPVYQMKIYFVSSRMDIGWTNRKIVPLTCTVCFLQEFHPLQIHLLYFLNQNIQKYAMHFLGTLNFETLHTTKLKKKYLNLHKIALFYIKHIMCLLQISNDVVSLAS